MLCMARAYVEGYNPDVKLSQKQLIKMVHQTIWSLKGIFDNKQCYTEEAILINPIHIVSIIPTYTDLDEDNE